MRRFTPALLTLLLLGSTSAPMAATLTLVCGANPQIHAFCRAAAEEWAAANGHSVRAEAGAGRVTDQQRA
jgi:hypothetical protein